MTVQHTRNVLKVYRSATDSQHAAGMSWYSDAHNLAFVIGRGDIWKGAGLLAAYSPLTPWWRNVILAVDSANSGIARKDTLSNSWKKAQRILDGESPIPVLNADKTQSFCSNIALNGKNDAVTIDVHAFSIAHYRPISSKNIKLGKPLYRDISNSYRRAAAIEGILPTEMQAITWVVWRERYPNKASRKAVK